MKKTLTIIMMTLITIFTSTYYIQAQSKVDSLVIHYYRYDNNYDGYNVWLWQNEPVGLGGKQFNFSNSDVGEYGAFVRINLKDENYADTTRFGIIIKKGGWEGYREPGGDRFFRKSNMEVINNEIHAYLVEQDLNIGTSTADLENNIPDYRPTILSAYFNKNNQVIARLSHQIKSYEILADGERVLGANFNGTNLTASISNVDLTKTYELKVVFAEDDYQTSKLISIQNLYDTKQFEDAFTYDGDLGVIYSEEKSTFRLWAPISSDVKLNIYNQGHHMYDKNGNENVEDEPLDTHQMTRIENGAWEVSVDGNLANKYYTFSVTNYGITNEVTDPYSYSTGANGLRSMIVNFDEVNPENWTYNNRPNTIKNLTDYIVYELHVRDLTTHSSWNGKEEHRGKFLGFTDTNTTYELNGTVVSTGLDHIVELGVNAVQLLPIFDFGYIDEVAMALDPNYNNTFNWGYMPYHFNTLEGSYSTNPFDGAVRINEFKQLVNSLHENDVRVIMDVVYNHTGESEGSNFHKILPGYYHRLTDEGGFYNGSGTGNETASERSMVRNFMLDSIKFLATEYNLSGFRFDLMRLHDVETMQQIEDMLHSIDPTIVIYGEPWDAGGSPIDNSIAAGKDNIKNIGTVGAFNDTTRDAVKGSTNGNDGAWVQGHNPQNHVENIKYGISGGVNHSQVNVHKWHLSPERTINYVSAHDNLALHDKLRSSGVMSPNLERMQVQANAIILTSQGIPFIHAGAEMMRSKPAIDGGFDENSYESPDSVNQLNWTRKARYNEVFEYYKALIQIRKHYPQFRFENANDIINNLNFIATNNANVIAFEINHPTLPSVVVVHNGQGPQLFTIQLPAGKTFRQLTDLDEHNLQGLRESTGTGFVLKNSTAIFIENKDTDNVSVKSDKVTINKGDAFNPLNNINFDSNNHKVYTSSFYNTNVSGKYLINVTVVDSKGNFINLYYTLEVSGSKHNFGIKGDVRI